MNDETRRASDLAAAASRICVLTGAGISTDSGIPDFRGPNGLWTQNASAARYLDFAAYRHDPALRVESWQRRAAHPAFAAEPNQAHRALGELHQAGRLPVVITQNIDGLHQRAGVPADAVIELHGSVHGTECLDCGERGEMADAIARVRAGEADPPCADCGGVLKSATVFFGQPLDGRALDAAVEATRSCDLFIAIGTSLTVTPAADLVPLAARSGAAVAIVNAQPTPYDALADVVVREPIGTAIPAIVAAVTTG